MKKENPEEWAEFEAQARYLSSSLIVTIPVRIVRQHGLGHGHRLIIRVRKEED